MGESVVPKLPKWPFFVGDLLLLGGGALILYYGHKPLTLSEMTLLVACVAMGALVSILPYLLEYRAVVRLGECARLVSATERLGQVEDLAARVTNATNQWAVIQGEAEKTAHAAKAVADGMGAQLKDFTQFVSRANDSEKSNLRLEVEKLRRAEGDWMQVLVRMLDHVFALHQAAQKSGQQRVIEQISRFQHACCDAARRVGLAPFIATPDEQFDAARHQWAEGNGKAPDAGALVGDTLATGFTFQGRVVRPALVKLKDEVAPAAPEAAGT